MSPASSAVGAPERDREILFADLHAAWTLQESVDAIAAIAWRDRTGSMAGRPPATEAAFAETLSDAAVAADVDERLRAIWHLDTGFVSDVAVLDEGGSLKIRLTMGPRAAEEFEDDPILRAAFAVGSFEVHPFLMALRSWREIATGSAYLPDPDGGRSFRRVADPRPAKHPMFPMAKAWVRDLRIPVSDDLDSVGRRRRTAIAPAGLFPRRPVYLSVRSSSATAPSGAGVLPLGEAHRPGELPLFDALEGSAVPSPPLIQLADAAGVTALKPGRGARIDKRIFLFSLLSMPRAERLPGVEWLHERPVWWWRDLLLSKPTHWRPGKHGPLFLAGLEALVQSRVRLSNGRTWAVVMPDRDFPDPRNLNSLVRLRIELPPGCDHGAAVSWPALIEAGASSDPALDAVIGLAYHWDAAKASNGGFRIYAVRPAVRRDAHGVLLDSAGRPVWSARPKPVVGRDGRRSWPPGEAYPVRDWRHPSAVVVGMERHPKADRVAPLSREDRRRLVFPMASAARGSALARKERERADRVIRTLESGGRAVVEELPDGFWRILEPPPRDQNL